jgi:hypothetical protein
MYNITDSSCRCCVATSYIGTLVGFVFMAFYSVGSFAILLDKVDAVLTDVGVFCHWFKALLGNLIWFFLRPCVFLPVLQLQLWFFSLGYWLWICPVVCPWKSAFFSNHFGAQFVQVYYTSIAGLNDLPVSLI